MHRLFVALRPPPAIRALLREMMDDVPAARWQNDDQLHLTLRFIGGVERSRAEDIALALARITAPAPIVSIAGVGRFDKRGRTDTLWAGVAPHEALAALHRKVDRACVHAGLPPAARAYLPHITLARLSRTTNEERAVARWLGINAASTSARFALDHLILYESHLDRDGARYEAIARWPLAAGRWRETSSRGRSGLIAIPQDRKFTGDIMATTPPAADMKTPRYAWYVLSILFLVYILNFVDRQIISILAEDIKRDLNLKDEDLGFLYGTAFGVFYSLFGIPLGRLADNWHRVRLMTVGLALWSAMTALSGLSKTGGHLAAARIGVGVGEATASPSAYSLISDYFPKRLRATALAIYSSGLYVGGGLSLGIGGLVVQRWNAAYPNGGPFGLHGWQATFLIVGIPGLLMAVWIATLREPIRGAVENLPEPDKHPAPFREFLNELVTILPPLTLIGAARGGGRAFAINLLGLGVVVAGVLTLIHFGEPWPQWIAVGIGAYAVFSWACALKRRDPPTFALIVGNPAFLCIVVAYGLNAFVSYAVGFWAAPYALRNLGASPASAGAFIGGSGLLAGFLGVTIGGIVADRLRRSNPSGRILVVIFGAVVPIPFVILAFTASSTALFYPSLFGASICASCALGAAAATMQDLVLPRMRGTATGTFFIGTTLLGLAMGPYIAGRVSTLSGSLSVGVLSLLLTAPITLACAIAAYRLVPRAEGNREARARAAGEAI